MPSSPISYTGRIRERAARKREAVLGPRLPSGKRVPSKAPANPPRAEVEVRGDGEATVVDRYWNEHTVIRPEFESPRDSYENLHWRFEQYPLFREFTGLWDGHDGEVVLDYGCGPGNDLTGFALHSGARKLIGMDISRKALQLSSERLALHEVDPARVALIQISDASPRIPLDDNSVDHVNCQGVLMVTSHPEQILAEFKRVLRPEGRACVMVYNRESVWFHLHVAYEKMIVNGEFGGMTVEQAFTRSTDGPECPVSFSYVHEDFESICRGAGLEPSYMGGYPSVSEPFWIDRYWARAIADTRLADEHRDFLRGLTYDPKGYPMYRGYHAGIGGVYWLTPA